MSTGDPSAAPETRVGHRQRDAAVERLRAAAGEGQITMDELETRVEAALAARTAGDLAVLLEDLPDDAGAIALSTQAPASARLVANHSSVSRLGSWRVPAQLVVSLRHSSATIDLRGPNLPPGTVRIELEQAHGSSIKLLVAADTPVDVDGVSRHHSTVRDRSARSAAQWSGTPVVVSGDLHHSTVIVVRPRRPLIRKWSSRG
jgi:hypothetical protein